MDFWTNCIKTRCSSNAAQYARDNEHKSNSLADYAYHANRDYTSIQLGGAKMR